MALLLGRLLRLDCGNGAVRLGRCPTFCASSTLQKQGRLEFGDVAIWATSGGGCNGDKCPTVLGFQVTNTGRIEKACNCSAGLQQLSSELDLVTPMS